MNMIVSYVWSYLTNQTFLSDIFLLHKFIFYWNFLSLSKNVPTHNSCLQLVQELDWITGGCAAAQKYVLRPVIKVQIQRFTSVTLLSAAQRAVRKHIACPKQEYMV